MNVSRSAGLAGSLTSYVLKPKRPVTTRMSVLPMRSNLPSVMPAASAERSTYSRLADLAAPGGNGSAALAAAGIAKAVRHTAAAAALLKFMLPSGGKRPLPGDGLRANLLLSAPIRKFHRCVRNNAD